jgi:hypothetical protein
MNTATITAIKRTLARASVFMTKKPIERRIGIVHFANTLGRGNDALPRRIASCTGIIAYSVPAEACGGLE